MIMRNNDSPGPAFIQTHAYELSNEVKMSIQAHAMNSKTLDFACVRCDRLSRPVQVQSLFFFFSYLASHIDAIELLQALIPT